MGKTQLKLLAVAGAALLVACGRSDIGEPEYRDDQCRRIALMDSATGDIIRGAEDFAVDPAQRMLFISAYDRRAAEKAARKKAARIPGGGLYALPLSRLFEEETLLLEVAPMAGAADIKGGLRPHGLAYDARNKELVFINRAYHRIDRAWEMVPRLERISAAARPEADAAYAGKTSPAPCAANDVLTTERQTFTSFDHGACDWRAGFEAVFNLKRSGLAINGVGRVYEAAGFANGLTRKANGEIVMAATRENALVFLNEFSGGVEEIARVKTPGGPDNLSISYDGAVVAATHASLWRLALNRKLGIGKAPSRIVKTDPQSGGVNLLFDDASGALFSAATVAVETPDGLVVGSVTDEGVLVCGKAP